MGCGTFVSKAILYLTCATFFGRLNIQQNVFLRGLCLFVCLPKWMHAYPMSLCLLYCLQVCLTVICLTSMSACLFHNVKPFASQMLIPYNEIGYRAAAQPWKQDTRRGVGLGSSSLTTGPITSQPDIQPANQHPASQTARRTPVLYHAHIWVPSLHILFVLWLWGFDPVELNCYDVWKCIDITDCFSREKNLRVQREFKPTLYSTIITLQLLWSCASSKSGAVSRTKMCMRSILLSFSNFQYIFT